jgi:hypothetical protein
MGGGDSFGSTDASGIFTNCIGGSYNFGGGGGTASGIFTNCTGDSFSFGGEGTISGELIFCRLTSGSYETISGSGIIRFCLDGDNNIVNADAP